MCYAKGFGGLSEPKAALTPALTLTLGAAYESECRAVGKQFFSRSRRGTMYLCVCVIFIKTSQRASYLMLTLTLTLTHLMQVLTLVPKEGGQLDSSETVVDMPSPSSRRST